MVVGDFAVELDTVVIGAGPGGYVAASVLLKWDKKWQSLKENTSVVFV